MLMCDTIIQKVAGFGRRTLRSSLTLLSVVGAIWRAGLRKEVGLLSATWSESTLAPNVTVMCPGHGVPEMVTPAMTTPVLLGFLNLNKYAMFSFAKT